MEEKVPEIKEQLMKCLICGEVFEASLGHCPVCGVGLELCVPVTEEDVIYRDDSGRRYVILGAGAAGIAAAKAIRMRDHTGSITMVNAEVELPVNRPMLTKNLNGVVKDPDSIILQPETWYADHDITLMRGAKAESIDTESGVVKLKIPSGDGTGSSVSELPYDRLILATGAESFIPPFPGKDLPEVIAIRHLPDVLRLGEQLEKAKNAVVIGGGVMGLEAADQLLRFGMKVTVLEAAPQIMGRQIDKASADFLKEILLRMGTPVYDGVSIERIEGTEHVEGVSLKDGRIFPADVVVVSCGNKGNIEIAEKAGVSCERFIVADPFMRTNLKNVFTCGDCCQYEGVNYQLWQEASDQGRAAGANAVGDRVMYRPSLFGSSLVGFGSSLFAIGDTGKNPDTEYRVRTITDEADRSRETYWFVKGALVGAVLIGRTQKILDVTRQVTTHARHEEMI